jgi:23S rRNA (adenine2503-C2)-methyltransferase
VSLHTPSDELRDTLVPVNNHWSIDEVLSAVGYYADTFVAESPSSTCLSGTPTISRGADLLAKRLRKHLGQLVHVNVPSRYAA